jgi:hypothetical protein
VRILEYCSAESLLIGVCTDLVMEVLEPSIINITLLLLLLLLLSKCL